MPVQRQVFEQLKRDELIARGWIASNAGWLIGGCGTCSSTHGLIHRKVRITEILGERRRFLEFGNGGREKAMITERLTGQADCQESKDSTYRLNLRLVAHG